MDRRLDTAPALMDAGVDRTVRAAIRHLELPDEPMASGAGHDAAVFANAGVPSAMVFVRNENGSHNPREAMAMDDFLLAPRRCDAACRVDGAVVVHGRSQESACRAAHADSLGGWQPGDGWRLVARGRRHPVQPRPSLYPRRRLGQPGLCRLPAVDRRPGYARLIDLAAA